MSLLFMGLFIPHPESISLMGFIQNMIPVTLGNIIGGIFFTGALYCYVGSEKRKPEGSSKDNELKINTEKDLAI